MEIFKTKKLYRIEITERCAWPFFTLYGRPMPSMETVNKQGNCQQIPPGIKGWIIEKWCRKYFRPDTDQEGIDLFTPMNQPIILVPYKKVKNHYKII